MSIDNSSKGHDHDRTASLSSAERQIDEITTTLRGEASPSLETAHVIASFVERVARRENLPMSNFGDDVLGQLKMLVGKPDPN